MKQQLAMLSKVKARDVMQRIVFKLEPTMTVEEAARIFSEHRISGAPVVDRNGRLLGVLSAMDIAKPENMRDGLLSARRADFALRPSERDDDDGSFEEDVVFSMEDYDPEVLKSGTVADLMTPEVISVTPDASLKAVCTTMVEQHIHRVMVTDQAKLVGIISSLDVARCVGDML